MTNPNQQKCQTRCFGQLYGWIGKDWAAQTQTIAVKADLVVYWYFRGDTADGESIFDKLEQGEF